MCAMFLLWLLCVKPSRIVFILEQIHCMPFPRRTAWIIIGFFALIKLLIPYLFIHPEFELHRDEFLYLADADHLAWGYIEMPPMLAFLGAIRKWLGGTAATVHLWGVLFGAATMVLTGIIVMRLKGNNFAVFIACLALLCSGYLRIHI